MNGMAAPKDDSNKEKVLKKMETLSKEKFNVQLDNKTGIPRFVSGKLSEKSVRNVEEVNQFLLESYDLFQVDPSTDLTLVSTETDELGMVHYKFVQSVDQVPVDGAIFAVHVKDGEVKAVNGHIIPEAKKAKKKTKAKLNQNKAIKLAWSHIGLTAKDTKAEDIHAEEVPFHSEVEDTVEKAELVVYADKGEATLTYRVSLQYIYPEPANWQIYVDANTGEIVDSYNAVAFNGPTTGSGYGVLGDFKSLNTYLSNGTYYLYDTTKPMNGVIETRTAANRTSLPGSYSVDSDNNFNARSQGADVDAHAYAGRVYDYYKNTHNRNSFDNAGATIRSTVHYGSNYNNAFWNGSQMVYGDGDGKTFIALSGSLDVVAHEITHAVTERTAGLEYRNQSGALNESMSDIFGYFLDPNDWLVGEDVYTPGVPGDALRSISEPTKYNQPDHMNNYVNTTEDNGGVHINSGIPNKAGYHIITKIGKSKAEKVYYRALTRYLGPKSNFTDARNALLQATADLYGYSTDYNNVKQSWDLVGVY